MKNTKNLANIFSSKANVLEYLKEKISESKIEKMFYFSINEWDKKSQEILENISTNFHSELVIIRSSAIGEDSIIKSEAGNYLSVQNIDSMSKHKLKSAVSKVIKSYLEKENRNSKNQILVQKQTPSIITSGVIFTKSINVGSPYYIINFDDGVVTDSVTKGEAADLVKIFRYVKPQKIPSKWKQLIKAVQEIERIVGTNLLDIEFGINTNNEIIIFQVRPLTSTKSLEVQNLKNGLIKSLEKNKKSFIKFQKSSSLIGNKTIFSDMSDWNPAEIIGNEPNLLDYSLYDYLIMKKIWSHSRNVLGYTKIKTPSLMVKFGQKPYVDVRASFNSFLPSKIPKKLKHKLISYYLKKLSNNPFLHDKVEFEILFTCHDPMLKDRLKELRKNNFSKEEIKIIENELKKFTDNLIDSFPNILRDTVNAMSKLQENRRKSKAKLIDEKNYLNIINTIEELLDDCRDLGTLYFSIMARLAFVSSIILKSLVKKGFLETKLLENFMGSLQTPLLDIQNDVNSYVDGTYSKKYFLSKYGHLRPGTYDILASRYDKDPSFFNNVKFLKTKKQNFSFDEKKFKKIIQKNLSYNPDKFLIFAKESITQREKIKFEFTKNLSDTLELIAKLGELFEFSREEISNLSIDFILKHKNKKKNEIKNLWKKNILLEKNSKIFNYNFLFPPLLITEDDFYIHKHYVSKPNFITNQLITKNVVILNKHETKKDLHDKIIVIEQADPGFDWIFTHNPAGLITKYGGVASHMAIRCSELGLPASIGCGEMLYNQLMNSTKILLDCKNNQIIFLESKNKDEFFEEKKILKSLGYIK